METLLGILLSIIGGLGFLLFKKSKQNIQLKADNDLQTQKKDSKIVDGRVDGAQKEIDSLNKEIDKPVKDDFWKDYTKDE